ncbi:hypothetical protein Ancab_025492 [Ancistrocladus abbreviatus]
MHLICTTYGLFGKVGHSIASYISIKMFKSASGKVIYCIGLYPNWAVDTTSSKQITVKKLADSLVVELLALLPIRAIQLIGQKCLGKSWSATAFEAACSHLVQYHLMQSMFFMARTDFKKCWLGAVAVHHMSSSSTLSAGPMGSSCDFQVSSRFCFVN